MAAAIIMAGGSGKRTKQAVPKQFLTVNEIPIIVYTMQNVQAIKQIDEIVVVSPEGWESFVESYAEQFGISKLKNIVSGGETRHQSIYNGLCALNNGDKERKVCLVDANRPLIPESVFLNVLDLVDKCDCAVAVEPCYDSMFVYDDGMTIVDNADRKILCKGQCPECARLGTLLELYESITPETGNELSTIGLAVAKGKKVLAASGHIKCFKITTADDFELLKAFLNQDKLNNII